MAEASRIVKPAVAVVLIGASVLGLINVYGDKQLVVALGEKAACADRANCMARMTQMSRTPIGTSFTFQIDAKPVTTVDVDCNKSAYLFGEWKCVRTTPLP